MWNILILLHLVPSRKKILSIEERIHTHTHTCTRAHTHHKYITYTLYIHTESLMKALWS